MNIIFQPFNFMQNATNVNFQAKRATKPIVTVAKEISEFQKKKVARDNNIIELLVQGVSRKKVAEMLDINLSTINQIALKNQVFKSKVEQRTSRIIEKFKSGISPSQIAKEENIDNATVYRTLQKEKPTCIKPQDKKKLLIVDDIKAGISLEIHAQKYNLHKESLRKIKKELGLTKTYNRLPKPQKFGYYEIKEQSQNITKLRETYRKFKLGERTPEILEDMQDTLNKLILKIQEFKSRL